MTETRIENDTSFKGVTVNRSDTLFASSPFFSDKRIHKRHDPHITESCLAFWFFFFKKKLFFVLEELVQE